VIVIGNGAGRCDGYWAMPGCTSYRVKIGERAIVFGTDQTGTDARFAEFARGADLLVLHMTVGVGAKNPLHAAPDVVGQVAHDAKPARLILSHLDPANLDTALAEVKKHYDCMALL
jgi:ribonuclease BN (tRNA processing enzyme)